MLPPTAHPRPAAPSPAVTPRHPGPPCGLGGSAEGLLVGAIGASGARVRGRSGGSLVPLEHDFPMNVRGRLHVLLPDVQDHCLPGSELMDRLPCWNRRRLSCQHRRGWLRGGRRCGHLRSPDLGRVGLLCGSQPEDELPTAPGNGDLLPLPKRSQGRINREVGNPGARQVRCLLHDSRGWKPVRPGLLEGSRDPLSRVVLDSLPAGFASGHHESKREDVCKDIPTVSCRR